MGVTRQQHDRVVITGIGMTTAIGDDRESTWASVRAGKSGVQRMTGVPGIADGMLLAAPVDIDGSATGEMKNLPLCRRVAAEAIVDSGLDLTGVDLERVGCSISAHMGDTDYVVEAHERFDLIPPGKTPWWEQWLPNTACSAIANDYGLRGPRLSNSTACATGTIAFLVALRSIVDRQCDIALTGSSQAIHPLFAAGFHNMRVLAWHKDPTQACRPFDRNRNGFVMGEGAAMFVLERLEDALARGASIYAEVLGGTMLSDAQHMTSLTGGTQALVRLIESTMHAANLTPHDVAHVNAHGTGTQQNDILEAQGIRQAFGSAADSVCVSASKSSIGHLVNASGSVELALSALALRDGFAPPTLNLTEPDPECDIDCIPLVGRRTRMECALKLSIAFGGHLAAVALRRWRGANERHSILEQPSRRAA